MLIVEKGYFSKHRIDRSMAKLGDSRCTTLKHKSNMTDNIPQKHVTLGEQGNIPYSWPQIMDSCLSSEVPMDHHHPEPEPKEDRLITNAPNTEPMWGYDNDDNDDDDDDYNT